MQGKRFLLNRFFAIVLSSLFLLSAGYLFSQTPQPSELKKEAQEAITKVEEGRSSYVYIPTGKRDPFSSPLQEIKEKAAATTTILEGGEILEGLRRFNINTLNLVGILATESGNVAMIKAPDGKSYILKKNSKVGPHGTVKEISKEKVVIEDKYKVEEKDYSGKAIVKTVSNEIVLSLRKKEGGSI